MFVLGSAFYVFNINYFIHKSINFIITYDNYHMLDVSSSHLSLSRAHIYFFLNFSTKF